MQSFKVAGVTSILGRVRSSETLKTFPRCYREGYSCQDIQKRSFHLLAKKEDQDRLWQNCNQASRFSLTKLSRNVHHNLKNDENQNSKKIKNENEVQSDKTGEVENLSHAKTPNEIASQHNDRRSDGTAAGEEPVVKEGILLRFKNTYKRHGKIFIAVHLATSSVWAGSFYYLVSNGVDVIEILRWMEFSQSIIDKFSSPSLGHLATTYLLYKLASPLRYTVTVGGTHWIVKYLQKSGKMPATPEENKIRSLLKEGGVKINKPSSSKTSQK